MTFAIFWLKSLANYCAFPDDHALIDSPLRVVAGVTMVLPGKAAFRGVGSLPMGISTWMSAEPIHFNSADLPNNSIQPTLVHRAADA